MKICDVCEKEFEESPEVLKFNQSGKEILQQDTCLECSKKILNNWEGLKSLFPQMDIKKG